MKEWQATVIKFLADELGKARESVVRVSVTRIQDYLSERGFQESIVRTGLNWPFLKFP